MSKRIALQETKYVYSDYREMEVHKAELEAKEGFHIIKFGELEGADVCHKYRFYLIVPTGLEVNGQLVV